MIKPTDDLEAVRAVAEALQGFDAQDQERIIRWAREKLGLVALPPVLPPVASEQIPPADAFDLPAPPAATSANEGLKTAERLAPEVPEVEQPEAERPEAERPEAERPEVEQPAEQQPEVVSILTPEPEQKSRLFMVIGIIALTVAVAFLIFMIASSHPQ